MSSYSSEEFGTAHYFDWTGTTLNNNYIIIKKLGFGSFSTVWLCYSVKQKKCYAVKILNPEDDRSGEQEIDIYKILNKQKSSLLVSMIEHFVHVKDNAAEDLEDEQFICIVLELMLCCVYDLLKLNDKNGFDPVLVKKIIYDTLRATAIIHKNQIIHTDIKPENMLLASTENLNKLVESKNNTVLLVNAFESADVAKLIVIASKDLKRNKNNKLDFKAIKNRAVKDVVLSLIKSISNSNSKELCSEEGGEKKELSPRNNSSDSEDRYDSPYTIERKDISSDDDEENLPAPKAPTKQPILTIDTTNLTIKLSDLGTCIKLNKIKYREIQTRHYRAPEILLRLKYNEKCDIWSIGCCLYELITGNVLFNPGSTTTISCDRYHVCDFISKIGMIPKNLIESSPRKDIFFKKNGLVRGVSEIDKSPESPESIKITLMNKLTSVTSDEILLIQDLISKMLTYDPDQRLSADQCLSHEWFKCFNYKLAKEKKT
ncbi:MAG: serine/threonine protein kinase [Harvfovirus sp.]|uniref:non-specific serine/threonine protein kinase n=1 Tax=Harvfovirus sp. TaxID=2487768 RepID=A0A3G5A5W2_9VIRU|nr:MAG: serine/threonine protein kinase [Harvfovirus sp.]